MERAKGLGATIVGPDEIHGVECDIFSPNALGGILNDEKIPRLKCGIVAGGANNQLSEPRNAEELVRRDILYAPDYIINAGGIINASCEVGAEYSPERAREKTEGIYYTIQQVLRMAAEEDITTAQAADRLAEERLRAARAEGR